ncbi:transmembrane protein 65 isoform X1 [Scophthalmus maximus]|uniref:transmembrane protein 65 isoform X1 n=1 Tax=Scophthalmus maximus TaxID=52904 RepID=UPI001FA878A5|nr:transmembrane protein 65 isoform X1 [Scophthalmus maximus]
MLKLCLRRAARPALLQLPPAPIARHSPGPSRRRMGTHGRNEPKEPLNSPKRAKEFIYRLQPNERTCLLRELQSFESIAIAQETVESTPLTPAQIRYVLFHNALPFVGFGFLDNAIMIAAGTQIELSIGVTLGISTMAAAALGNLVSDLAGLGLRGGPGDQTGDAGSRYDAQAGGHVADQSQLSHGQSHRRDHRLHSGNVPTVLPGRREGGEALPRHGVPTLVLTSLHSGVTAYELEKPPADVNLKKKRQKVMLLIGVGSRRALEQGSGERGSPSGCQVRE